MPVYTYHCDNCDHEFEKYQSFSEDSLSTCPVCSLDMLRKIYSPALVVFKGSGFYVTDTKSSSATLSSNNHKDNHSSEEKTSQADKKEEKKTDTKAEKKKQAKAEEKK